MENSHKLVDRNGLPENSHCLTRHFSCQQSVEVSLPWLDLKVFYVRVTNCEIDDSAPEHLRLKHFPLNHDTLIEINGLRTGIYSDDVSSLLRRDRLDKKSEEVTFVCTDSIRVSGSVKFEVFDRDVLLLSGILDFCAKNGYIGQPENHSQTWSMNCESDIVAGTGFLRGKQYMNLEPASPGIEVYVAGCFAGTPIILTKTLALNLQKKLMRKKMMNSIPENGGAESLEDAPSSLATQVSGYPNYKPETEDYNHHCAAAAYLEGEDGKLSWFNAGVRVGVGISLSICLGIGIGVGLLVRSYQKTTRRFRRGLP